MHERRDEIDNEFLVFHREHVPVDTVANERPVKARPKQQRGGTQRIDARVDAAKSLFGVDITYEEVKHLLGPFSAVAHRLSMALQELRIRAQRHAKRN